MAFRSIRDVAVAVVAGIITAAVAYYVWQAPGRVIVPNVVGKERFDADKTLTALGLKSRAHYVSGGSRDIVADQTPSPGIQVKDGAEVVLLVQEGSLIERRETLALPGNVVLKRIVLPIGTPIGIRLRESVTSEKEVALTRVRGVLAASIEIAGDVIANAGSPVVIDLHSRFRGPTNIATLSIREMKIADGQTIFINSGDLEIGDGPTLASMVTSFITIVMISGVVGMVVSILLWFILIPMPPDWGTILGALIGVFLGISSVSSNYIEGATININQGTELLFYLEDSTLIDYATLAK